VLLVAVALPVVWFFAPLQLHGHTGYVIVKGVSMHGKLENGDLALLREASSYRVGDVVAYHNAKLGAVVLHRIVKITPNGHYRFRGDNNDFVDGGPYPTARDLVGVEWVRIPKAGALMLWIRSPFHMIAIAAFALFLGLFPDGRRRPGRTGEPLPRRRRRSPASELQLVPAIALACLGGLWLVSLAAPTTKTVLDRTLFTHHGSFSWTGTAPTHAPGFANGVSTGDVVFVKLDPRVRLGFDYRLGSTRPLHVRGSGRLQLDVSGTNGWHTVELLGTPVPLRQGRAKLRAVLDLASIIRLAHAVDRETGVVSTAYAVKLTPRIQVSGEAGVTPIDSRFAPSLSFSLDASRLVANASTADQPNDIVRSADRSGLVTRTNSFGVGPRALGVTTARSVGRVGTLLALVVLLAAIAIARGRRGLDEPALVNWRYGDWLVPISQLPPEAAAFTDVADIAALVRLAERYNRAIMHLSDGGVHTYLLSEHGVTYRYRAVESRQGHGVPAAGPA
jgi:signal peptidase I